MKLLIHDLEESQAKALLPASASTDNTIVISDDGTIRNCVGCFGCWIKTPAACVIRDNYGDLGETLAKCDDELVIISECFYGGFSPFVKNVMDRAISYVHPDFVIRNKEMHHKIRYRNHFDLTVWFYGADISENEKATALELVQANADNFDCTVRSVGFIKDISEIEELIK
ncbi:MAG TPA: flavoprotein [Ruminococcaceae bacterium]|nr:flavoprotein [Oscillospiraceae bacterium]